MPFYSHDDAPYCSQECYEFVIDILGNRLCSRTTNLSGRERKNEIVRQLKTMVGCIDCGFVRHHAALDFDHVYGVKKLTIGRCKNLLDSVREMAKCEIRCANCHRIKTWERAGAARLAYFVKVQEMKKRWTHLP
jgi:hypothetical protein